MCNGQVALSPTQAIAIPSIKNVLFPEMTCPPPVVGHPIVM
ncbi:hypothetical protein ODQ17_12105 [Acinetobacter sp. IRS14]|uniref:Uncharacterized protein n=1 Tax=Acinetobacter pittii (strain PHEA-2) TaxID=871585 RepID=F0KK62_ACIP2|nr:hypothetical protein [Acinetobacter pittii]YP_004994919.1 hypothetical protein BDGL_000651 [Acinetobacter pittii PHEA-2]MCG6035781.1 hypothetical protein [Acinetobacter baumannii]MCU7696635.1 hypothetical protein [Acinetobacter sp. AYS6]MDA3452558.1 hypothetical protein [Acinetobacter sp. AOR43_HL]MEA1230110.1 hypothetical protein [Acinetobacter sp. IRS14]USP42397.1 hypothetical protein MMY79_12255 [Acinetobacter sp. XS-4]